MNRKQTIKNSFFLAVGIFVLAALLFGCNTKSSRDEIRISINPWVGFTPFMYASEKGWLEDTKIKLIWAVGLGDSSSLYDKGLTDGFLGTQYEYLAAKDRKKIKPYMLIDISNGADVILSNKTIDELKHVSSIDGKFELNSVNLDLFEAFIRENGIDRSKINIKNYDQVALAQLKAGDSPTLIISYEPYSSSIKKNGFKEISSTRDLKNITIVDALFVNENIIKENKKELTLLRTQFQKALAALKNNPREYYESVKGYLENQTYEQFLVALEGIEWIDKTTAQKAKEQLQKQSISTEQLAL